MNTEPTKVKVQSSIHYCIGMSRFGITDNGRYIFLKLNAM